MFGKTDDIFREYPMVLLMAFLAAVSFMATARGNFNLNHNDFVFVKFGLVSCLGISLMFGLKILSQRIGKGILFEILGVIFLILFYYLLPETEKYFTEPYAFLLIPTFILSHLLVSFIAFFGEKKELNFWQYNKNLFINIFLTSVFTGVLIGGVELAILAVDKLFDFNFNSHYYLQTFYFLAIFGSCFIFLLFNEKGLQDLEKDGNYPLILKFFTQYILIPLLLIYVVILYFDGAKILINWELPRGWVSYLVLAYSIVGILGLLLVHPLKQEAAKSWVKIFSKIFYYTMIPLIVLLFIAIFTRILQYGYTEPRYFVLLLALWLTAVVLYFVFTRRNTIKFIPMSLFAFGLFALIFPYLNTFSVAKRSQKTELQKILVENKLLENGKINFAKKVSDTIADEISDKFKFLAERKAGDFLFKYLKANDQKIFAKNIEKADFYKIENDIRNRFSNIENTNRKTGEIRLELVSLAKFESIENFDYMINVPYSEENKFILNGDKFQINNQQYKEKLLTIKISDKEWNLTPFILQTLKKYEGQKGNIEVTEITAEKDLGNYRLKIVFANLVNEKMDNVKMLNNGIYYSPPILLVKKK
ncbi:ABC transporter permease [Kaistella jeonii]|uniref:ABC transporter permease n=1 Tax=Kaistella jeonii TaxID=266749 RepID=A0A0C1CUQ2_9FLAO|nr:ABC transporter permease [Kaistella jeonii]